jgi:hypothetical protein
VGAVLISSKTMICVDAEVDGDKLVIRGASAGARDWFGESKVLHDGALLRELVHVDDWCVLGELRDSLHKATTSPTAAAWLAKIEMDIRLSCDKGAARKGRVLPLPPPRASASDYVQATMQIASYPESNVENSIAAAAAAGRQAPAPSGRAVLMFR